METPNKPEFLKDEYKLDANSIRASVLKSLSKKFQMAAEALQDGDKDKFDTVNISPNHEIDLGDGFTLGLQVSADDLRKFTNNTGGFEEVLNQHLHIGHKDDSAGDRNWVKANVDKETGQVTIKP